MPGESGMSGAQMASMGTGMLSGLMQTFEMQKQTGYERSVLANNTLMTMYQRDAQLRDITTRSAIMSGKTIASAGASGVTTSGSVTAAAADVMAKSAVDALRVNVMAQNTIELNTAKSKELKRQATANMTGTLLNTGVQAGMMAFI